MTFIPVFEDAEAPVQTRSTTRNEPNPFDDEIGKLAVDFAKTGKPTYRKVTVPAQATVKDTKKLLNKLLRQLTMAGTTAETDNPQDIENVPYLNDAGQHRWLTVRRHLSTPLSVLDEKTDSVVLTYWLAAPDGRGIGMKPNPKYKPKA